MRVAKLLSTSITAAALAFSMLASALPANAASGYHAAYFSESSFLGLAQGGTGQLSVGYSNTGDQAWTKGATSQASLNTRNGDTTLSTAGWASGWVSSSVYANQANDLVAPGQVGFFIYNIVVPANAAPGEQQFTGRPSANGELLEDYGYYQSVTVTSSAIAIASTTPASPSNSQLPTVAGTGAGNAQTVTIKDGTTSVGTGTSTSTGAFSIVLTTSLAEGSHSLTAGTSAQTSAAFTYVVDLTKPKVSSASSVSLTKVTVTFDSNMNCASIGTGTWTIKDIAATAAGGTLTAAGNSTSTTGTLDCLTATVTAGTALTNGTQYTVAVTGSTDAAGNAVDTAANSATFVASDTTAPTATAAAFTANNKIKITFSEPVRTDTATGANYGTSATNPANYTYDSQSGSTAFLDCGQASATNGTFADSATCTLAVNATTATHTITVFGIKDAAGNLSGTSTLTAVFPPSTVARPTITSVTSPSLYQIVVTYDSKMGANAKTCTGTAPYVITKTDGTTSGVTCATVSADSASKVMTLTVTPAMTGGNSYNLVTTGTLDVFGNAVNPSPTVSTFSATADTTQATATASTPTAATAAACPVTSTAPCNQTQFTVTYSEAMQTTLAPGITNAIDNKALYTLPAAARDTNGAPYNTTFDWNPTSCTTVDSSGVASTPANKAVTCIFSPAIQPGSYTLTIGAVRDLSGNGIATSTVTVTFTDTTKPTANAIPNSNLGASQGASAYINLTFSEVMDTAGGSSGATSVLNPANYKIDNGVALTTSNTSIVCGNATVAGTIGTVSGTCLKVFITISSSSIIAVSGNPHIITITGVKDLGANALNPDPTSLAFTAN